MVELQRDKGCNLKVQVIVSRGLGLVVFRHTTGHFFWEGAFYPRGGHFYQLIWVINNKTVENITFLW